MENYTTRLQEQAKALQADIDDLTTIVIKKEEDLDKARQAKTLAFRELRSIEKKLEKLKV